MHPEGGRLIIPGHYTLSNSFLNIEANSHSASSGVSIFNLTTRAKVRILVFSAENIICTYCDILASITSVLLAFYRKRIEKNYVPKMSTFDKITVRAENTQYDYSKKLHTLASVHYTYFLALSLSLSMGFFYYCLLGISRTAYD